MNLGVSFKPVSLPKVQPQFGTSLHPLTSVISKVMGLAPSLPRPALNQLIDILMTKQDYKPVLAATFPDGSIGVVSADRNEGAKDGIARFPTSPARPKYYVFYGQPGDVKAIPTASALLMSSTATFYFDDRQFSASMDSGIATGIVSMTVNGQTAANATNL